MPDATLGWELDAQQRARKGDGRHRWLRIGVIAVAVLAALGLVAGATWAWLLHDTDQRARRSAVAPPRIQFPDENAFGAAKCRSPLTPDDPLRLWIGGDSLAGLLGPALGKRTAETGVVEPTYDFRVSSGLASPSFFDWPKHASEEMQGVDPELVVFIIGANDTGIVRDLPLDQNGQSEWRSAYVRLVDQMLDVLSADDRIVYWIGSPPLRDDDKDRAVREVNDVARDVVQRRHSVYIDAYDLFSDPDGRYTGTLPGSDGDDVRVRTSDGIHFTPAGADLLAKYVFQYLDQQCHVERQAVPGHRQPVHEAEGSGEVPGSQPPTTGAPPASTTTLPPTTQPPTTIVSVTVPALVP